MSSLLGKAEDASVQEGFLCPVCLQSCSSIIQLQNHVETAHDRRVLRSQVKQLFGKAKKFIKIGADSDRFDVSFHSSQENLQTSSTAEVKDSILGSDPFLWENHDIGQETSHWEYFLTQRSQRIDKVVVETNKILLRLDKLVNKGPPWSDQNKRKVYEKEIVPWEGDSSVKFCRYCSDRFSLTTRKHHCRLCGRILCNKCSYYMTHKFCKSVLSPTPANITASEQDPIDADLEQALRICKSCNSLSEKHRVKVKEDTSKPVLLQMYEKINETISAAQAQIPVYNDIVESLQKAGEVYSREDAEAERTKVLKAFEVIDTLSKKILRLTPNDKDTNSATTEALHRRIRAYVVRFLQDSTFELKHMPSEDDIKRWRAEKSAEKIRRREEEERRVNTKREEVKLTGSPSKTADTYKAKSEKVGKGWTPTLTDQASVKALTDDPLLQQINIISGYLIQAQSSGKWDEANALEANLKELHLENRAREMRQNEAVAGFYE